MAGFSIRPGDRSDLREVAELYLRARHHAVPAIPALVHSDPEVLSWVGGWDLGAAELWVAEVGDGPLLGFVLMTASWVDHLYVDPELVGEGVGSALLELAQSLRPDGLGLWVFESNRLAQRFYARHGFVELERTDGSDNEEGAPDIHLHWSGGEA